MSPNRATGAFPEPRFANLRAERFQSIAQKMLRARPRLILPMLTFIWSVLFFSGFSRIRLLILISISISQTIILFIFSRRAKKRLSAEDALFLVYMATLFGQASAVALTGALASPLAIILLPAGMSATIAFGRSRKSALMITLMITLVVVLACLPRSWSGAAIRYPYNVILTCEAIVFSILMLRRSTMAQLDTYLQAGDALDQLREDFVTSVSERSRDLEYIGAKVAHELKNPLSAVKGLVQLLTRASPDDRFQQRLSVIQNEIDRMEVILEDYLSFARPLQKFEMERVDLALLVFDLRAVLEARAKTAGVNLQQSGAAAIHGDPRRLKEALLNLLINAIEATPSGGWIQIRISQGRDEAKIEIEDSGKGLPIDQLSRVGAPFYTTRKGGTGLGVILARSVFTQHRGSLEYDSKLGQGTTATIRLPCAGNLEEANG